MPHQNLLRTTTLASLLALTGCAVGPNFHEPAAPATSGLIAEKLPTKVGDADQGSQSLAIDSAIPAQWWTLFHSKALNDLVEAALRNNPTIDAANAAVRQADELAAAQRGSYYPTVNANYNPTRQKVAHPLASPAASGAEYYTLHTAQLNIGFVPDVFGSNRRTVESLDAQAEMQRYQLEAAKLTLASNVVVAAIQEASLRAQINATRDLIKAQQKILDSFKRQLELGQVAQTDVMGQETQLAQSEATLPPLEKQLTQTRDLLISLAGKLPAEDLMQQFTLDDLHLPETLPVSLPSNLIEQRPDVRAASAQLHSASAQVGIAVANRLPSFQISGSIGNSSLDLGDLFKPGGGFWNIAGNITQPIFDAGTLKHRQRAAEAAYDQAAAQYRSTVITAFQNVADSLHAIVSDAEAVRAYQKAERTAKRSLDITQQQLALGNVGSLTVVNAEQAWLQTQLALVGAQANRLSDSAALIQALGGGWWSDTGA
ncbi:MAG: efflux transporter outer membrane subunit [Burkholderiales bacterium]|nr:efflux transporter outer membrane subunit [Burkholderiales bacterium]